MNQYLLFLSIYLRGQCMLLAILCTQMCHKVNRCWLVGGIAPNTVAFWRCKLSYLWSQWLLLAFLLFVSETSNVSKSCHLAWVNMSLDCVRQDSASSSCPNLVNIAPAWVYSSAATNNLAAAACLPAIKYSRAAATKSCCCSPSWACANAQLSTQQFQMLGHKVRGGMSRWLSDRGKVELRGVTVEWLWRVRQGGGDGVGSRRW